MDGDPNDTETSLANLPPTSRQRRWALVVAAALFISFGVLAPFTATPLPRIDAFIPTLEALVFVTDLITSVLLFAHFSIYYSRPLLVLASGYLFTALIVIPHALTFPGAFSPTGLLGAGLQSTAWLWIFWHAAFPTALVVYALLKDERHEQSISHSTLPAIGWSVAVVVGLVCGLTWLAIAGDKFLPPLFVDRTHPSQTGHYIAMSMIVICACALVALWIRRRSVLDLWLLVVAMALVLEMAYTTLFTNPRFSLGFYVGRTFSLVTSTIVLVVLLAETTRLYGRLARSNAMLQRERNNKLMNLEAMAASFSHEMKQPLGAIVTHAGAALRFLVRPSPDFEEVRSALTAIAEDGHRAGRVFDNLRALFGKTEERQEPIDMNELALATLRSLRDELREHDIAAHVNLRSELPPIMGHRGQLQEVITNLVQNAVEAMADASSDRRVLKVSAKHHADKVILAVQDAGLGIDSQRLESIFEAFVTTKPRGMGLGLAICRMIVERHDGQLTASSAHPYGSVFQISLPQATGLH